MDLLINTYGTRIRSTGERIVTYFPQSNSKKEYPARRIEKIIMLRPGSISTGAIQLAIENDIDIVFLGSFGKPIGRIFPSSPKGLSKLRRSQLETASSYKAFYLAKCFVAGKAGNQVEHLKRLETAYKKDFSGIILQMETLLDNIKLISDFSGDRQQLLGIEGYIAERYFSALQGIYKFPGRKPQGRDKFNSALNYGYGILYNEVEQACMYAGLDTSLGLYHSERYGKPALVLDLVEEFRVPLVDSVIFPLFADKILTPEENFCKKGAQEYMLSVSGKRKLIEATYTRLNSKVKWGGKTQELKKVVKYQILMLSHYFLGKKRKYKPFDFKTLKDE